MTFADSANTLGLANAAIEAGLQYIENPAGNPSTTRLRRPLRLKPMIKLGPRELLLRLNPASSTQAHRAS